MTKTQDNIEKKKINKYEFKIIKINDLRHYEQLVIELSINECLRELLLKDLIVKDEPTQPYHITSFNNGTRYLCKGYVLRELYSDYKYMLSDIRLLNEGKIKIYFESIRDYDNFLRDLKSNFKRMLEILRDYKEINLTITAEL